MRCQSVSFILNLYFFWMKLNYLFLRSPLLPFLWYCLIENTSKLSHNLSKLGIDIAFIEQTSN